MTAALPAIGDSPRWEQEGRDWPNRQFSQFLEAGGLRWHVQRMGSGPRLLLLHGTGASTHSWRALAPLLAEHFTVLAPDLPGHGFTKAASFHRLSLPEMSRLLNALLQSLEFEPALAVGHSAGAAILIRMTLDGRIAPRALVSLNGALQPFRGLASKLFPTAAKLLFLNPLTPRLFAKSAEDLRRVEKLIGDTGSRLDPVGLNFYARLFRKPGHVAGTLSMMANWDLAPLTSELPRLKVPLLLVAGGADRAVPPKDAYRLAAVLPNARVVSLPGLGHLAHEERPEVIARLIVDLARERKVLPSA